MNKIMNWTVGSFFRTIGRIVAYAIIGFLLFLLFNGKVSALVVNNTTFPDFPDNNQYFFIMQNDSGYNNQGYYGYTSDTKFYVVCVKSRPQGYNYSIQSCNIALNRLVVSESVYNNQPISRRAKINNTYYVFTGMSNEDLADSYINSYSIDMRSQNASWSTNSSYYMIYAYQYGSYGADIYINKEQIDQDDELISSPYHVSNYNVHFHLNNSRMCRKLSSTVAGCEYQDYIMGFPNNSILNNYLNDFNYIKDGMVFTGWYYDINFLQPYNQIDPLDSDIDLYAKYIFVDFYENIRDLTFDEHIFPDDKNYAVLNVITNLSNTYLAFEYEFTTISVFQYNPSTSSFNPYAVSNMQSIGFVDNLYYYYWNNLVSSDIKIIIISKDQLQGLSASGELLSYNKFYTTDNVEVTFTNDLTNLTIWDSYSNSYEVNASEVFYNNYQIISSYNDISAMFKKLSAEKNGSLMAIFGTVWNKFLATPLVGYFTLVFIGSLIIYVIKIFSRK